MLKFVHQREGARRGNYLACALAAAAITLSGSAQQLAVAPGTMDTIAGIPGSTVNSTASYSGPATGASLRGTNGLHKTVVDAAGNIYFADRGVNVVRKLTPVSAPGSSANPYGGTTTYTIKTVAGNGSTANLTLPACTGGPTAASASTGIVLATAGDGCPATTAALSVPYAVGLDSLTNPTILFIADLSHYSIRAVNLKTTGNVTYAGGGTAGNITIAPGNIATVAGMGSQAVPTDPGISTADHIYNIHGLSVDPSGNLIISDTNAATIRKVTNAAGNNFTTIVGGNTSSAGVTGVGTVCTTTANAFNAATRPCGDGSAAGPGASGANSLVQLSTPEHAFLDAAGNIYVSDFGDFRLRIVNSQSTPITLFGVTIAPGAIETVAGNGVKGFAGDGGSATPTAAQPSIAPKIGNVAQAVLDAGGALYFADQSNNRIRRVDPSGIMTTLAGGGTGTCSTAAGAALNTDTFGDGCAATTATIGGPDGVSLDPFGNILITDTSNYLIRRVNVTLANLVFSSTGVGAASTAQTVTLYNTSATAVTFSGISVSAGFVQASGSTCTNTTTLAAGQSCVLNLAFAPQALGAATGLVTIASNSTTTLTINLSGTGAKATSTTTVAIAPNPAAQGQAVTFTATVAGPAGSPAAPTGTVIFTIGSTTTAPVNLTATGANTATATYTTSSLTSNTYSVTAAYGGDTNFNTSNSTALPQSLVISTQSSTVTTLQPGTPTPVVGQNVTLTATVSGTGSPTGSVKFYGGTVLLGTSTLTAGAASITVNGLALGANSLTAVYSGDGTNLASTSSVVSLTATAAPTLLFVPGILTTVAGNGTVGSTGDGGTAISAQLNAVNGVAVDAQGNVYLADTTNNAIRVVNMQSAPITIAGVTIASHAIATVAGSVAAGCTTTGSPCGDGGLATSALLRGPVYIKLDTAGNIYIADTVNNAIRVVNTQSTAITIAGVTIQPSNIATVVDTAHTACASTTAACGDGGLATAAQIKTPRGLFVDPAGNIFVVDNGDFRIRKVDAVTGIISTVVGSGATCAPVSAACGDGGLAINASLASVHGMYVDTAGQIFFADDTAYRIRKVDTSGILTTIAGTGVPGFSGDGGPATAATLTFPGDVIGDAAGNIYIAAGNNNGIRMINPAGVINTIAGNGNQTCTAPTATVPGTCYTGDGGNALAAQMANLQSLAIDTQGNIYAAESGNNVIRKLSAGSSAISYGNQPQGTTSAPQNISVINTGTQPLGLTSITIPAGFIQQNVGGDCAATTNLAAGASCILGISFAPPAVSTYTGSATLGTNSINAVAGVNPIALVGAGTYVVPTITLAPAAVDFGNQATGIASAAKLITLTNTGTSPFPISSAAITGSSSYTQTNNCPATLTSGQSCTYSVVFNPSSLGALAATLTVTDSVDSVSASSTFTGVGTPPAPGTSFAPSSVSFGNVLVGTASTTQPVTLTNNGTAVLNITAIAASGTGFSQTNNCGSTLAIGASCTITVGFTPTTATAVTGAVSVTDNAAGSPQSITLSGSGIAPQGVASPTVVDFGTQLAGTTSGIQSVTLSNPGNAPLAISSVAIVGANPGSFAQTNNCGASLAAGASCSISITFSPAAVTSYGATLVITDSAAGSPQSVALSGTGIPAAPTVGFTPTSLSFGNVSVGTTSSTMTAQLKNGGNATLIISGIAASGPGFAQTNNCGSQLTAGSTCTISVTFTPAAPTAVTGAVSITDNAGGSPQSFALTGTGTAPQAILSPVAVNFGSQSTAAASAPMLVTLSNPGNAALSITGISIAGANAGSFTQTSNCGSSLAASASCTISVIFSPTSIASFAASLSVADNAAGSPQAVALSGAGIAPFPVVSLSPSALSFGSVAVGVTSASQKVTLANTGTAALNLTGLVVSGPGFASTNSCGAQVAVGGSCTITVAFAPATYGAAAGAVTITDNASGSPHTVSLNGIGMASALVLSPTSLTFGSQVPSTASTAQTVTLSNPGNLTLNISGITLTGTNANSFNRTTTCGTTLAAGATCSIFVVFVPTTAGALTANLSVAGDAPTSPQTVALSGTGAYAGAFALSAIQNTTLSVNPGGAAAFTVNVAPTSGSFAGPVTLSVTGLPKGATATFTPPIITPGSGGASSVLLIQTVVTALGAPHWHFMQTVTWALMVPLLPLLARRRRRFASQFRGKALMLFALFLVLNAATGCGSTPAAVAPTTSYTLTITGTSGVAVVSTQVTLVVR